MTANTMIGCNEVIVVVRKNRMEQLLTLVVICCVVVCVGINGFIHVKSFDKLCNSDVYADCQVAKRMWEEKTLFPDGWAFGNQIYVIATPVLAALLYGVVGDINHAMILATLIMTVLIFISLIWLLRGFTSNLLEQALGCLLLLASIIIPSGPESITGLLFFNQASFYACYLITLQFVFGDYIRCFSLPTRRPISWMAALILCFATGMQSLRQTAIMILPMIAYETLRICRGFIKKERPLEKEKIGSLVRAMSYAGANIAGVAVSRCLDVTQNTIYGDLSGMLAENLPQKLESVINAFLEITTLDLFLWGDLPQSLDFVIVFMVGIVFFAAVSWIFRITKQENGLVISWLLCGFGILGVFLATILLNITIRSIYVFMWFPFVVLSGLIVIKMISSHSMLLRQLLIVLICVLSMVNLRYSSVAHLERIMDVTMTAEEKLCNWAVESGYTFIYGDYWGTAPQIAVYSHGSLDAGCWHRPENVFYAEVVNTPQNIYGQEENERAIYVFTEEDEEAGIRAAKERNIVLTKVAQFDHFQVYTASEPLMRTW